MCDYVTGVFIPNMSVLLLIRQPGHSWCSPAPPPSLHCWRLWWGWGVPVLPAVYWSSICWQWVGGFVLFVPVCSASSPCPGPPAMSSWISMTPSFPSVCSMRLVWPCTSGMPLSASVWAEDWCCAGAAAAVSRGVSPICKGIKRHLLLLPSTTYIPLLRCTNAPRLWRTIMLPHFAPFPAVGTGSTTMSKTEHATNTLTRSSTYLNTSMTCFNTFKTTLRELKRNSAANIPEGPEGGSIFLWVHRGHNTHVAV